MAATARLQRRDLERLRRAALRSEQLSRRAAEWNGVEEVRWWREARR